MEAVILAGGFGTRIRPLTYTRPKPLLPLLNRPLLANIIDRLPQGINRIILPVNYLKEQIEGYFEEHPDPRVVLVEESTPLGTGGAIKNCRQFLTGQFLVVNGDVVCDFDLQRLIDLHRGKRAEATISLWPVEEPWHFGVVQLAKDGRISKFVEKPPKGSEPSNLINAGHYVLEPSVLDAIESGRLFSIEREVYMPWAAGGRALYGLPYQGYWIDCGRPESLLECHRVVLAERGLKLITAPTAEIDPKARVEGYAIGDGAAIGPGCHVQGSVLMDGVELERNVTVVNSILGEGVEVEAGARLENVVAGDFAVVARNSTVRNQRLGMKLQDLEA